MEDWDDLRYFIAIAQNGSVTAAANKLGVNHSTVSRRIQGFENKHNVRLFERIPTGYVMTQSAENIYQTALDIQQHCNAIERQLFGQDSRLQGKIVITAPNYIINEVLMPHVLGFQQHYPGVDLVFHSSPDLKNMAAREADIAIRLTAQPPETLVGREVARTAYGLYATKSYWKNKTDKHKIILRTNDSHKPSWLQNYFPDAEISFRADSIETMATAAMNNMGIAHIPCIIGDTQEKLFRIKRKLVPPVWGVWVLSHVDLRSTARIRVAREFLIKILLQQKNSFEGINSKYITEDSSH